MRSYSEMVRKSAPFLVVYSKADNVIDAETVNKEVEKTKRKRREAAGFPLSPLKIKDMLRLL